MLQMVKPAPVARHPTMIVRATKRGRQVGTAHKVGKTYVNWYRSRGSSAFIDKPRIVVAVMVDEPSTGVLRRQGGRPRLQPLGGGPDPAPGWVPPDLDVKPDRGAQHLPLEEVVLDHADAFEVRRSRRPLAAREWCTGASDRQLAPCGPGTPSTAWPGCVDGSRLVNGCPIGAATCPWRTRRTPSFTDARG